MTAHSRTRLVLEVDLNADPISGEVIHDEHNSEPFSGWISLTRTIEFALDGARNAGRDQPSEDLPPAATVGTCKYPATLPT